MVRIFFTRISYNSIPLNTIIADTYQYSASTYTANVSPKELLNIQAFELSRVLDFDPVFLDPDQEHQHDDRVSSVSCRIKGNVNQNTLSGWIGRMVEKMFQGKG